jgi:hypothetical protein
MTSRVATNGKGYYINYYRWILDGFPLTKGHAIGLESRNFQPNLMIQLKINEEEIYKRSKNDLELDFLNDIPRLDHIDISILREKQHIEHINEIRTIYENKYMNWHTMDGNESKWSIKSTVHELSCINLERRQNYLDMKTKGDPAPIGGIGISRFSVTQNLGEFHDYCPVCLLDLKTLSKSKDVCVFVSEYKVN